MWIYWLLLFVFCAPTSVMAQTECASDSYAKALSQSQNDPVYPQPCPVGSSSFATDSAPNGTSGSASAQAKATATSVSALAKGIAGSSDSEVGDGIASSYAVANIDLNVISDDAGVPQVGIRFVYSAGGGENSAGVVDTLLECSILSDTRFSFFSCEQSGMDPPMGSNPIPINLPHSGVWSLAIFADASAFPPTMNAAMAMSTGYLALDHIIVEDIGFGMGNISITAEGLSGGVATDDPVLVDSDLDFVLDDGDASGSPMDNICTSGVNFGCDDNCPTVANTDQTDSDADGIGDACEGAVAVPMNSTPALLFLVASLGSMSWAVARRGFDHRSAGLPIVAARSRRSPEWSVRR